MVHQLVYIYMKEKAKTKTILLYIFREEDFVDKTIFLAHFNLAIKEQMVDSGLLKFANLQQTLIEKE